jgi:hypothetical protein
MKRIYLNTKIDNLSRKEVARVGNMVFSWCRKNMGVNNRKHYLPTYYFSRWNEDPKVCGEYDDETNEIFVYYKNLTDIRELIQTIVHEWQHQLQPLRTQYYKYKGPYNRNPFEIEAKQAEEYYLKPLWETIKGKVNRK